MVYGILNSKTGEFRYVSAGHPGPVHLPSGEKPVMLKSQGFPIGLSDDPYEEFSIRLAAGDRLYLYSDGVTEIMSRTRELYGNQRLLAAIELARSVPLQESVTAILRQIAEFQEPIKPQDDISILAVEMAVTAELDNQRLDD